VLEPFLLGERPLELRLTTMRPASHRIELRWWVLPTPRPARTRGPDAPPDGAAPPRPAPGEPAARDRGARGPLPPIEADPAHTSRHDDDGEHVFTLRATDLEPGLYRVVARARDTTELRGERWPWVLADPRGLLESERAWWVEVPPR
jgi:hypothetical protein